MHKWTQWRGLWHAQERTHTRRRKQDNVASIVAFLSATGSEKVTADSEKHTLINLHVIGNQKET
jgi:hypothetical protein